MNLETIEQEPRLVTENLAQEIKKFFKGDIAFDDETLSKYSKDASIIEIRPELVLFPKDSEDVKNLVVFVSENKEDFPTLSITGRAAGTDMSGGPINDSIIIDFTKYFTRESADIEKLKAVVQPGVFYRDFETITLPEHVSLPVYPASKTLAALGGMVMNNCAK